MPVPLTTHHQRKTVVPQLVITFFNLTDHIPRCMRQPWLLLFLLWAANASAIPNLRTRNPSPLSLFAQVLIHLDHFPGTIPVHPLPHRDHL